MNRKPQQSIVSDTFHGHCKLDSSELIRFTEDGHSVQFYDDDEEFLFKMVANFLSPNLNETNGIVVIGNQACRNYLGNVLSKRGSLYNKAFREGRIQMFDNASTLAELMENNDIELERFNQVFRTQIVHMLKSCSKIFAYGDIVNLLVEQGKLELAIKLENLWNDLAKDYPLTILCGYNLKNLQSLDDYPKICHTHTKCHRSS